MKSAKRRALARKRNKLWPCTLFSTYTAKTHVKRVFYATLNIKSTPFLGKSIGFPATSDTNFHGEFFVRQQPTEEDKHNKWLFIWNHINRFSQMAYTFAFCADCEVLWDLLVKGKFPALWGQLLQILIVNQLVRSINSSRISLQFYYFFIDLLSTASIGSRGYGTKFRPERLPLSITTSGNYSELSYRRFKKDP